MMEPRLCAGITRSGERCTQSVRPGLTYCHHHDPERAEERSLAASRAARAKTDVEIGAIKRRLKEVAEGVLEGSIPTSRGSVAFQGYGVLIRAIETERRIKETEELEARIQTIEEAQSRGGYG